MTDDKPRINFGASTSSVRFRNYAKSTLKEEFPENWVRALGYSNPGIADAVYCIREGTGPSETHKERIIAAANKYGLNADDMNSLRQRTEELYQEWKDKQNTTHSQYGGNEKQPKPHTKPRELAPERIFNYKPRPTNHETISLDPKKLGVYASRNLIGTLKTYASHVIPTDLRQKKLEKEERNKFMNYVFELLDGKEIPLKNILDDGFDSDEILTRTRNSMDSFERKMREKSTKRSERTPRDRDRLGLYWYQQ